ncbi:PEP-CTERM sorting domain-containing protein, partial [bacterium]
SGTAPVSFSAILSETITDSLGLPSGTASRSIDFSATPTVSNQVPFTLTLTVPFDRPLSQGYAIKDDLLFNASANTTVTVNSISQAYAPVPEPATLAGLALGGLALLRRRKR